MSTGARSTTSSTETLVEDPYGYYDQLRAECPVLHLEHLGVVAVTGYDEATEVYRDTESFSSCNSVIGPFAPFPDAAGGRRRHRAWCGPHRDQLPMFEHMVTMDPPDHTRERALLHAAHHAEAAEGQRGLHVGPGRPACSTGSSPTAAAEFISAYTQPFAMLAVADLLGVPEEDHQRFVDGFGLTHGVGARASGAPGENPLALARRVVRRLHRGPPAVAPQRRAHRPGPGHLPGRLGAAGHQRGADGDVPLRRRARRPRPGCWPPRSSTWPSTPSCRTELRADRELIPNFLEEVLRVESPVKTDFRMTPKTTTVGGVEVKAGTPLMMLNGAANRDPRRFECPARVPHRPAQRPVPPRVRAGHPLVPRRSLARAEGRISLERILDRMTDIRLSPRSTTARPTPAGSPTSRRGSSGA